MDLTNKVALVTGGGRGIGQATARRLGSLGAAVLVGDQDMTAAEEVALAIEGAGGRGRAIEMDVCDAAYWNRAVNEAQSWRGGIDVLVNAAGFDRPAELANVNLDDWQAVLNVHVTACLLGIQAVAPNMTHNGSGRIVNVSSIRAIHGLHGQAAYAAAKAGVIGLTKSMAKELAGQGILVNCVMPGLVDTPFLREELSEEERQRILAETPLQRLARPREIASVIAFLCSEEATYVCGAAWEVSGGWRM
jgi:NAD(P)-dependent dehydrogenase (short-subunit alcohol dehydrogenase family)